MSMVALEILSANNAAQLISDALGISGEYYLADNRRGRHKYVIPHFTEKRRVYYYLADIERFVFLQTKGSRSTSPAKYKSVSLSDDVWFMGKPIADDGKPVIEIVRGAGTEVLSIKGARELAEQLLDLLKVA